MLSICSFNLHFLMPFDVHMFICQLYTFFNQVLFKSFTHCYWAIFFLMKCRSSLYILVTNMLSPMCIANPFSLYAACHFIFFKEIVFSGEQKFLVLMVSNLSNVSLIECASCGLRNLSLCKIYKHFSYIF